MQVLARILFGQCPILDQWDEKRKKEKTKTNFR